ncbi:ABC transporter substrate-binding protein [Zavarzinia compransoris]|uniref:Iron ABC transporter substrate-binding protein n=1 Tax=Zavarzinia compransoris TaxID=1264899 RepID=A0A317DV99_9PROT|nr:ABC transporter substrate-binding protein [Zavarzinia compransoris]PWR18314.1 iron ABC transporter substrate-binding protein [Zavarzinia compransoris]TDP43629.1 putative spermidine/putrescine transport system substrate-binding protein [Zavarzinia compransoris]
MKNFASRATCRAFVSALALAVVLPGLARAQAPAELVAAATKEGALTVIALPHDWCNYGEVIAGFKAKYPGITVNELNPDAGTADELEAIRANKGNTGAQAPDVVDLGLAFAPAAAAEGLLQPYKVATWAEIPDSIKDANGYWYGDYYGVMAFGVNKDLIEHTPADWPDLKKPEYSGAVALTGDPRASAQAILALMSAGLSRGAKPGTDSGQKGLELFAELNGAGNFVPVLGKAGTIAQGQTPIVVAWDYNLLAWRDGLKGNPPMDVVVPENGVVAGVYVQAISAYAPHPNAAKLWMEYLYSDEGQTAWLKGYCHPARFNAMQAAGKFPQELLDKLPPAAAYEKAVFPTVEELAANKTAIVEGWDKVVGATVK